MSQLRICVITYAYPRLGEPFIFEQVEWLRAAGHRVDVIAHLREQVPGESPSRFPATYVGSWLTRSAKLRTLASAPRAAARHLRHARDVRGTGGPEPLSASEVAARATLAPLRSADVVLAHFGEIGADWLPVALLAERPFAVFFHGFDTTGYPLAHPGVYDSLFRSGATLITNGSHLEQRLVALGAPPEHIALAPYGASPAIAAREWAGQASRTILTIARLVEKKGLDDSIRAFAASGAAARGWTYDIVGIGPLEEELRALAGALGVADSVRFRGKLARPAVADALTQAGLVMLTSRTASSGDTEGTPVFLIEACAVGVPTLATQHASAAEILPPSAADRGLLVPERDVAAIAAGLRTLTEAAPLRAEWGAECRRHSRATRSSERHRDRMVDALRRCVRAGAPRVAPVEPSRPARPVALSAS